MGAPGKMGAPGLDFETGDRVTAVAAAPVSAALAVSQAWKPAPERCSALQEPHPESPVSSDFPAPEASLAC
jgi:hypothetical protein